MANYNVIDISRFYWENNNVGSWVQMLYVMVKLLVVSVESPYAMLKIHEGPSREIQFYLHLIL
jgi:hypothetical protein